jgi:hypothetical protein
MKNIIYGLGRNFWNNLEFLSDTLKDTIALCDADGTKFEHAVPLGIPTLVPAQLPDSIAKSDVYIYIYISTDIFYKEVFEMLTKELKIPPENIAPLPIPNRSSELLALKHNYFIEFFYGGKSVPIKAEAFDSAVLLPDRADALKYMPKNGIAAEVGVAYGDFSRKILDCLSPKKFYAIDYFRQDLSSLAFLKPDWCQNVNLDNMTHQQWYENSFKEEIASGAMELRQGLSWDCLAQFPDDYFDYVYLDAAHDYHSVKKDIEALKVKVKNGGFIQFNDYCVGPALGLPYGVINAVNSFVNTGKCKVKYFCINLEPYLVTAPDIVVQLQKTSPSSPKSKL